MTEKHTVVFALRPPVPTGPTIDILIDPPIAIDAALKRAETKVIDGVRVSLATVEDMIALKRSTGRAQDDADIEQLNKLIRRRK